MRHSSFRSVVTLLCCVALFAMQHAAPALAANIIDPSLSSKIESTTGLSASANPSKTATQIINVGLSFLGLLFFVLVVYAGAKWMLSQGNEEDVTKAQGLLRNAIIGLFVILAAYGIAQYVFTQIESATGAH